MDAVLTVLYKGERKKSMLIGCPTGADRFSLLFRPYLVWDFHNAVETNPLSHKMRLLAQLRENMPSLGVFFTKLTLAKQKLQCRPRPFPIV